ncbi:MAG: hypothetical protein EPN82_04540 [Bacteroidetes bacterium]|nr:MAG: hypothetical protein EPN82_04540 [Bacteroidota bacterium]
MIFVIMLASLVCIAQNSVHDNTSTASRIGSGSFTCEVLCDDDDEYGGVKIVINVDDSTSIRKDSESVPTSGYELLVIPQKQSVQENKENNPPNFVYGIRTMNSSAAFRLISNRAGREAESDADGYTEELNSILFDYLESENMYNMNKDFVKFEVNINYSYSQM